MARLFARAQRARTRNSSRVLALLALALTACSRTRLSQIEPRDRKVLLLGIDGLDYEILKPVLDTGHLPKLAELRRRGILVPLVGERAWFEPSSVGVDPARSWTTIATGFPSASPIEGAAAHGVRSLLVPLRDRYDELPATSQHRAVPNVWDVLGAAGVRCAVVGWWTTWPAEPVNGALVSDRFFLEKLGLTGFGPAGRVDLPAVPESYRRGAPHLTWPEALADELAAELAPAVASADVPILARLRELEARVRDATTRAHLQQVVQAVRTDLAVKDALRSVVRRDPSIRFAACHLDALDVATHLFWMHIDPLPWQQHKDRSIRDKLPRGFERFRDVIPLVAQGLDAMVRELCDAMGPDVTVVIVNDHTLAPDVDPQNRDFDLTPLLEELGLLVRKPDGTIDWSKTTCFDRTPWPRNYYRRVSINFAGEWPQGSVALASPQERPVRWSEVQAKLLRDVTVSPTYASPLGPRDQLFYATMGELDSYFMVVPLPGDMKVKLPGRETTLDALFPPQPTSGRHADPGMLLVSYPGEVGDRYGRRGIPMGKGGGQSRQVAPLVLALFGIPCSEREDESAPNADFLFWMLDFEEAQRLAVMPRVESYEERLRFRDPTSPLGARRAELLRYLQGEGYDFEAFLRLARETPDSEDESTEPK